ncbi:MAG: hypothetical protein Q8O84_04160 [Nanoarchaeota archaeon]|nr:hypothetical protein [Nanoarchaeota archaeon]
MPKKESYRISILVVVLVVVLLLLFNSIESNKEKDKSDYPAFTSQQFISPENHPEIFVWMTIQECVNDKINSYTSLALHNFYDSTWKSKFLINGIEVPFELDSDNSQNDSVLYNYKISKNEAINITLFINETYFIDYSKECINLADYKMLR